METPTPHEIVSAFARGGPAEVLRRWPDVAKFRAKFQEPSKAEMRLRVEVESCLHLSGCLCNKRATCTRPTRPTSLANGSDWPSIRWADCLRCAQAGEHSPRVSVGR